MLPLSSQSYPHTRWVCALFGNTCQPKEFENYADIMASFCSGYVLHVLHMCKSPGNAWVPCSICHHVEALSDATFVCQLRHASSVPSKSNRDLKWLLAYNGDDESQETNIPPTSRTTCLVWVFFRHRLTVVTLSHIVGCSYEVVLLARTILKFPYSYIIIIIDYIYKI